MTPKRIVGMRFGSPLLKPICVVYERHHQDGSHCSLAKRAVVSKTILVAAVEHLTASSKCPPYQSSLCLTSTARSSNARSTCEIQKLQFNEYKGLGVSQYF